MVHGRWIASLTALGTLAFASYHFLGRTQKVIVPSANLLFNGWGISPAGDQVQIGDMPLKAIFSPDHQQLITATQGFSGVHLTTFDVAKKQVIQSLNLARVWNGLAFSPDGKTLYVSGGNSGHILSFEYDAGNLKKGPELKGPNTTFRSGVAVHPQTGMIYACDEAQNVVDVIEPGTLNVLATVATGGNPYTCVFGEDRRHLYVSNWGSNSVSVINTTTNKRVRDIRVGVRPNDMAVAPDGRLFVSCAGDNSVHIIQTRSVEVAKPGPTQAAKPAEGVREVLNTAIESTELEGSTPVGVSISPDGKTLFVANADNNDVMVADISNPSETHITGFIPTGWYPTSVVAGDDTLYVTVGKGLQSRANYPSKAPLPLKGRQGQLYDYDARCFEGYISSIPLKHFADLHAWTSQVRANTPFHLSNVQQTVAKSTSIVPDKVGKQSPIDHILYVIMENRTYDQVFGDLKEGNGEPYLCMYGEKVTPNRHKLALEYTLLDNIYCNSEVSVDGHSWCDAAIATDANQKTWTSSYSAHGSVTNSDDVQMPTAGFLWNSARRRGLSVKAYGEGDGDELGSFAVPVDCRGTWQGRRDKDRIDGWISDLHESEKTGHFPNFMIMSLGEDHTSGTTPGAYTPEAAVASNDQAIGKIIAAISHSKFWKSTAIFFVEDDAQNGPDHVDAHRTFGLVVSPWVKRHNVDHTMYSQVSMVRTIELFLGLPPMTQFDAAAIPMFETFGRSSKLTPYDVAPAQIDLDAKNTPRTVGARASLKMDFSEYDKAPADQLNEILWAEAKGANVPYPGTHRTFTK